MVKKTDKLIQLQCTAFVFIYLPVRLYNVIPLKEYARSLISPYGVQLGTQLPEWLDWCCSGPALLVLLILAVPFFSAALTVPLDLTPRLTELHRPNTQHIFLFLGKKKKKKLSSKSPILFIHKSISTLVLLKFPYGPVCTILWELREQGLRSCGQRNKMWSQETGVLLEFQPNLSYVSFLCLSFLNCKIRVEYDCLKFPFQTCQYSNYSMIDTQFLCYYHETAQLILIYSFQSWELRVR